jgi:transposase
MTVAYPRFELRARPRWAMNRIRSVRRDGREASMDGKPYSIDLRERVVWAVEKDGLSCHWAAGRFDVGISTAINWVRRLRETGSVASGQMGGHKPKSISGEQRAWLLEPTKKDFTLRGLVTELAERGLKVDYRTLWGFVHAEKLSFKENRGGWPTRPSRRRSAARAVEKVSRSHRP